MYPDLQWAHCTTLYPFALPWLRAWSFVTTLLAEITWCLWQMNERVWSVSVMTLTGKLSYSEKKSPQCHFVHQDWLGLKIDPSQPRPACRPVEWHICYWPLNQGFYSQLNFTLFSRYFRDDIQSDMSECIFTILSSFRTLFYYKPWWGSRCRSSLHIDIILLNKYI
jgi:hypothetical protein